MPTTKIIVPVVADNISSPHQIEHGIARSMCASIQLSITVSSKEIGLRQLYHSLLGKSSANDRSQLIRQVLFDQQNGSPLIPEPRESIYPSSNLGVKVRFSIKQRDIGFETMFHNLAIMTNAGDRNRHVRELLYQACQSALQQTSVGKKTPLSAGINAIPVKVPRQEPVSPVTKSSLDLSITPEQVASLQAEKRALIRIRNIEALKLDLPETTPLTLTTTTIQHPSVPSNS